MMRTRAVLVLGLVTTVAVAGLAAAPAHAANPSLAWAQTLSGWNRSSSPTIADVSGDGIPEIVIGHQDGYLRVLNAANGQNIAHWPQPVSAIAGGPPTAIDGTAAVADLDKNGTNEIVVPLGSTWKQNQQGGVVVLNRDGTTRCRYRTGDEGNIWANTPGPDGYSDAVYSSPAIGDVNGDGAPDIVFGAFDLRVHAIDRNCHPLSGFPYNVEDSVWSSPALYDVNGDGRVEILIGGDQMAGGFIDWSGGEFRAIQWTPTGARELWKRQLNDTMWSSPALGDINGDGRVEVVVGGGHFYHRSDGVKVFAWHADDGSAVPGWPIATFGSTMPSPALGDVTGDGIPEVAVASYDSTLRVYRGNGQLLWSHQLKFNTGPGGAVRASPIVADMNGDGWNDVGVGNEWGFWILDGRNGSEITAVNTWQSFESAGAVGNFGPAGWKLVTSGFDTPNKTTRIEAQTLSAPGTPPPWPMFRREPSHRAGPIGKNLLPPGYCRRSSNPKPAPVAASSHGYWTLGVDGAVYALNGAPYKGNAVGRLAGGHAVGIAATPTGLGYYVLSSTGAIVTFGDGKSYGSMAGKRLNAPIIALAATPGGKGYWLLGRDGGVFSFGDARFYGSMGGHRLNAPIISMSATRTGRGYWLLASDGGVFSFGDARFKGSTGGMRLAAPVISMAAAPSGAGYWLVAKDGGVFSFGVPFYGSLPGTGLCMMPLGMQIRPTLTGAGYFVQAADGRVFAFGDAKFGGSAPPLSGFNFAVDMAVRP
jgi:hypothetical protein